MSEQFPRELWDDPAFHKGREWGRMEERERIIKLLETNTGCGYEHYETEKCFCEAVELIKGENK